MGEPPAWIQFLPFTFLLLIVFPPIVMILRKAGYSGWWALLAIIPFAAFLGLWFLALARWPALQRNDASTFH
jgi:uncharacterized membrane protein YhaH (DUF805 family)